LTTNQISHHHQTTNQISHHHQRANQNSQCDVFIAIEALISTFAMFLVLYIAFQLLPTALFGLCENDIWQIMDEET